MAGIVSIRDGFWFPTPAAPRIKLKMTSGMGGPNPEVPASDNRTGLRAFRFGWTIFLLLATSAPYLVYFYCAPGDSRYTWILPPYPEDAFGYMAWVKQAALGHLLFQLKFTAVPHHAFLFHPFFLMAGWISLLFGGNVGFTLFLLKGVGVVCFLLAFYKYADYLGLNRFQSMTASILIGVASGLGGLLVWAGLISPASQISGDLWLVDMNTFWSLLWNPLFPYSLTLLLLALFWLDRGSRDGRNSDFWRAGITTGILALTHPYSQPLLFAFAVIITALRKKSSAPGYVLRFFAAAIPFVVYVGLVARLNPLIAQHNFAGEMSSPPPVAYLLGFGLPLLFCGVGAIVNREQLMKRCWPVILWFVLSVALAYFPFWFQRKLIFGAHVALCIVAAVSIDLILNRISKSPEIRRRLTFAAAIISLPLLVATPVYLLASENREVRNNTDNAYYINGDTMDGLIFLRRTNPGDVVFATSETSRLIPGLAGNTVVWGHWAQSVDLTQRHNWITNLFNERADWTDPNRAREFWGTNSIQYIFADGAFKQSIERDPRRWQVILNDADAVFTNREVLIYRHRNK